MRLFGPVASKRTWIRRVKYSLAALFLSIPLQILVTSPALAAGTPGAIVVNEFNANGQNDWVELYNTSGLAINVDGWSLKNQASVGMPVTGEVPIHGFLVVEIGDHLGALGDTLHLFDETNTEITSVVYGAGKNIPYPGMGQSAARTADGGVTWAVGTPTKGTSNVVPDPVAPPAPTSGAPNESLESARSMFSWQPVEDNQGGTVRYELRASQDAAEVGAVLDATSTAWRSGLLATNTMPASAINVLADGTWYWQVRAVDEAGNKSSWSSVWSAEFDLTAPVITTLQPAGPIYGGPSSLTIPIEATVTDLHAPVASVILDGIDITTQLGTGVIEGGTKVMGNINAKSVPDGVHTLIVRVVDSVGNSSNEAAHSFVVDTTAPGLTTNLENEQTVNGVLPIKLWATDAHLMTSAITIFNSRGGLAQTGQITTEEESLEDSPGQRTFTWDTSAVEDGAYTVRFFARDTVGNETFLNRTVIVKNSVGGIGGEVLQGEDPLLQQLSQNLTQPFVTPQALVIPQQRIAATALQQTDSGEITPEMEDVTDVNGSGLPVTATEEGWRILGILWYWRLLIGLLGGVIVYRSWQIVRQYRVRVIE